jgi:hypothetical protein
LEDVILANAGIDFRLEDVSLVNAGIEGYEFHAPFVFRDAIPRFEPQISARNPANNIRY